jgi:hypothetical protein
LILSECLRHELEAQTLVCENKSASVENTLQPYQQPLLSRLITGQLFSSHAVAQLQWFSLFWDWDVELRYPAWIFAASHLNVFSVLEVGYIYSSRLRSLSSVKLTISHSNHHVRSSSPSLSGPTIACIGLTSAA